MQVNVTALFQLYLCDFTLHKNKKADHFARSHYRHEWLHSPDRPTLCHVNGKLNKLTIGPSRLVCKYHTCR